MEAPLGKGAAESVSPSRGSEATERFTGQAPGRKTSGRTVPVAVPIAIAAVAAIAIGAIAMLMNPPTGGTSSSSGQHASSGAFDLGAEPSGVSPDQGPEAEDEPAVAEEAAASLGEPSSADAANLVSEGLRLFEAGDYGSAFDSFSAAAELGDADGLFWRGYCYYFAYGTARQWDRAYEDFLAASQENVTAGAYVGVCLYNGRGVARDREASYYWFSDAADAGDPVGQNGLGNCYKHGIVVEQDSSKAFECYLQSASQGFAMGQVNLGAFYDEGICVEVDKARAAEYYTLAASQGNSYAQYYLALMYYNGEGVSMDRDRAYEYALAAANNEHDPTCSEDARAFIDERY